jgi:hypothetical protein
MRSTWLYYGNWFVRRFGSHDVFAGSKLSTAKVQHDLEFCINSLDAIVSLVALLCSFQVWATLFGQNVSLLIFRF